MIIIYSNKVPADAMSKKNSALWTIIVATSGNSLQASFPVPGLETHKHVAMTSVEITMCLSIAKIYFGDRITKKDLTPMFQEAGIAIGAGGGLGLVATKVGHVAADELLNFAGPVGWALKAGVAGTLTATIGLTFLKFCENRI